MSPIGQPAVAGAYCPDDQKHFHNTPRYNLVTTELVTITPDFHSTAYRFPACQPPTCTRMYQIPIHAGHYDYSGYGTGDNTRVMGHGPNDIE